MTYYEIKTTELKNFTYRIPLSHPDENGELQLTYSKDKCGYSFIKKITFLNLAGYDENNNVISYQPLDDVNNFLLEMHIQQEKEESDQYSKGLTHYFTYIIDLQEAWDKKYSQETYDELVDPPRPSWDSFAYRKHQRVTYMYHKALKSSAISGEGLAKTTAQAYMRAVVKFYTFHLRLGKEFNHPPFEHEIVKISYEAGATSMKSYLTKDIHTSDLRLTFPRSKKNDGGKLPNARRDLRPFNNREWEAIENILTHSKRVIKNIKGRDKWVGFAEEYCLFFLICRFTGLRKEEAASLHLGQITTPDVTKPMMRLGVGAEYGSLTKTVSGGNKSRRTVIPTSLMAQLKNYSKSDRYKKRFGKFIELCEEKKREGEIAFFESVDGVDESKKYLFLSATGVPFFLKLNELNNRWNEVKKAASRELNHPIEGVIHNLRPTFAVSIFRMLLKTCDSEKALAIASEFLGHEDLATTLLYLQIAEDNPTGDEIWEDINDYLNIFEDVNLEQLTDKVKPLSGGAVNA
ncbi:site-specific integrase [Vibrio breoganii]|uniref:site-specific integrase n=1 Tax=Vibrio breoganii TaxID=553239 RepID=UPI000C82E862|nr:site-specific integrase [Vibrio breoganii]PMK41238.1 integrase [Vibrio breoganii]